MIQPPSWLPLLVFSACLSASLPLVGDTGPSAVPPEDNGSTNAVSPATSDVNSTPTSSSAAAAKPTKKAVGGHPSTSAHLTTYTVVAGDSLSHLSRKFGTSIRQIKKLNHLTKDTLRPGQVLKVPGKKSASTKKTATKKVKTVTQDGQRHAEPVQDFDLPASNFASCPVPLPSDEEPTAATPSGELDNASPIAAIKKPSLPARSPAPAPMILASAPRKVTPPRSTPAPQVASAAPAPKPVNHGFFNFFYTPPPTTVDWGTRFTQSARQLGDRGLSYNDDWRPPGESRSWSMDCSNTARYLYKTTTGIQLPRTASDQYYYLHLQNKAWDVPQLTSGFADTGYLRRNLKAGDLLFWENTYKPDRQPPITHVMVFLGTNDRGEWIMAGSQSSRGGEHNRRHGGPDIYVFNPSRPCGGYSTWMGLVHHQGRFCAYGRPLEADKAKLAVAAND